MGEKVIYISSEKKATPRVQDVLGSIAERAYPGTKIRFSTKIEDLETGSVLCFGKEKPEVNEGVQLIHTYSYPQIMSKRNAASVFKRSLELYFNGVEEPEFVTFYEPKDLKRLNVAEPMALDIETDGDPFNEDMQEEVNLLSISFYQPGIAVALDTKDWNEQDYKQLTGYLLKVDKPIWHNGKFDLRVLKARTGVMFKQWIDTMLMHHVLNIGAGMHGLEELSALYFGCEDWSKALTKYTLKGAHYERIPTDLLLRYNALDVYYTYKLYEYLYPQVQASENHKKALWLEMQFSEYLLQIELNGMPINDKYIPDFEKILLERFHTSVGFVRGLAQDPEFNPNSPKQVKELLAQMGHEVASTDEDTITELAKGDDEWVKMFAENLLGARKANKSHGTYLQGYLRRTRQGRVRTAFKIHGTVTGRLSSGNPNVQNIPRDSAIKRIIGHEPGTSDNIIMGADYSQVELRVMAVLSQDDFLIESFQPGSEDFFLRMMYKQFGKSEINKMRKRDRDELRVKFKAVVYGLSYGRGARAIAIDIGVPEQEAQDIIDNLMRVAPKFAAWRESIHEAIRNPQKRELLTTVFGRTAQAEIVTTRNINNLERELISFLPQSTASDLTVISAIRIMRTGELEKYGYRIINLVHDNIMLEGPREHAEKVGPWVSYVMADTAERVLGTQVAFAAEAEWADNYGEFED